MNQPARHTSERDFQRAVVTYASLKRWVTYHTYDSRGSMAGFPDLVLVRDRVVFAELKSATGRVRPAQEDWLARLRDAGAETYVWRPAHWHQIEKALR